MLLARRCPYTGVVNFYDDHEPHMSVGSISRCGTATSDTGFTWRCYTAEDRSAGHAPDLETAERRLASFYRMTQLPFRDLTAAMYRT